jgi:hypothetical protein
MQYEFENGFQFNAARFKFDFHFQIAALAGLPRAMCRCRTVMHRCHKIVTRCEFSERDISTRDGVS